MDDAATPGATWRRSKHCADSACLEVKRIGTDIIGFRLSQRPDDVFVLSEAEWTAFLAGAAGGDFNDV
jgi:hypothetical protein